MTDDIFNEYSSVNEQPQINNASNSLELTTNGVCKKFIHGKCQNKSNDGCSQIVQIRITNRRSNRVIILRHLGSASMVTSAISATKVEYAHILCEASVIRYEYF